MQGRARPGTRAAWPFAAVCCLGLILFLVAATIVIALIPVYLSRKDVTVVDNGLSANSPLYLQYSATVDDESSSLSGDVEDLDSVAKQMNIPTDEVSLESGTASSGAVVRRKRSRRHGRRKRELVVTFLFVCRFKATRCNQQCLRKRQKFVTDIQTKTVFSSISIRINPGSEFTNSSLNNTYVYRLIFLGFSRSRPSGFRGAAPSATFIVIASGDFTNPAIWANGILPYGHCHIVIPAGYIVTLARAGLRIPVKTITIGGTLILGAGYSTFQFSNPISIRCLGGGKIQDSTSNKRFLLPRGSIVTIYPNGGFTSAGTVLQSYSPAGLGASYTIVSPSGPLTCAILPDGTLLSYLKVTFIAFRSGSFLSPLVYLGGFAPVASDCSSSACGLYIASGVRFSTADLGGQWSINIDTVTVARDATFEIGSPDSTSGFKFLYPITLNAFGTVAFVGRGGGILIPAGSFFNLMPGSIFTSVISGFLQVYDTVTGGFIGSALVLGVSTSGPFYITISITGVITTSTTSPGGSMTTGAVTSGLTTTPVTVAIG